jgi:glycyl-tRNA synthetase
MTANKLFNSKAFETVLKTRFIYDNAFSIYGGSSGFFDIGPVGLAIQNNIVAEWRRHFVLRDHMQEIDCAIITPELVLKNSGHLSKFADLMVRDEKTNESFRVDHLIIESLQKRLKKSSKSASETAQITSTLNMVRSSQLTSAELDKLIKDFGIKSPTTGNSLGHTHAFNLMFKTSSGPGDQAKTSYLRPETSQGIFMNFKRLFKDRPQMPVRCAQVGKAFRNEISPRGGLLRQREFLQAEIAHFLHPQLKLGPYEKFDEAIQSIELNLVSQQASKSTMTLKQAVEDKVIQSETMAYYIGRTYLFAVRCGIDSKRIRFRQHLETELAHYAKECWDFECLTSHVNGF